MKRKEKKEEESGETPEEFTDSWTVRGKKKPAEPEELSGVEQEEFSGHLEEAGEEDNEEDAHEIMLDLGGAPKNKAAAAKEGEVPMTIEASSPDVASAAPASGQQEGNEPTFEVETVEDEEYHGPEIEPYNPCLDLENYHYPTIDLMKHYDNAEPTIDMAEQNANKDKIINTLRSFGIEISTIKATVGPTVTLYEITPEQGVRISKIRGLEDDIALSLSALGIRIIAPIPGKGTIGIEVPNSNPKIVSGQSIIGSKKFQESTYDLPIALGKTITNEVLWWICARCLMCLWPVLPVRVSLSG